MKPPNRLKPGRRRAAAPVLAAAVWMLAAVAGGAGASGTAGAPGAAGTSGSPQTASAAPTVDHSLTVSLFPADRSLRAVDSVFVSAGDLDEGRISFLVARSLSVENVASAARVERWYTQEDVDPELFRADPDSQDLELVRRSKGVFIRLADLPPEETFPLVITYAGVIHDSLRPPEESYHKGFETTTGLVGDQGVFLSGQSLWYPFRFDRTVRFRLAVDVPAGWMTVSQGALARERTTGDGPDQRRHEVWVETNPTPEIYLVAGRYVRHLDSYDGISIMTYTYEPSDSLCQVYIDATKRYLALYQEMIGPYAHTKFALVENYWQTGFGMPSFTLLGSRVIRLPFIVHTSYGHEILHNWWGNSVYVDYRQGNWCEGLTTYGADYLYKEMAGAAEARAYRHGTLVAFDNYVTEGKDLPLAAFLERSDAATQSVGYGKSLMIYHMLRKSLGDEIFKQALREFYTRFRFREASWSDLEAVFSESAGRDLAGFFDQWLRRAGAPSLSVAGAEAAEGEGGHAVTFTLRQAEPAYSLDVPVVVETTHGDLRLTLGLAGRESTYTVETRSRPIALAVDPDYDLFRDLYAEEIPTTLGHLFAQDSVAVIVGSAETGEARAALREAAAAWGLGDRVIEESAASPAETPAGHAWLMGRGAALERFLAGAVSEMRLSEGRLETADSTCVIAGRTFVGAVRNPLSPEAATGLVLTDDPASLRALAARLPHYSSYSYLVFDKTRPAVRGVWKERASPLRVDLQAK